MNKLLIVLLFVSCNTKQEPVPKIIEASQETHKELSTNNMVNENDRLGKIDSLLIESDSLGKLGKIDQARENINSAIKFSNEYDYNKGIAKSLFHLSKLEFKYGVKEIAELSYDKSFDMYKAIGDSEKLEELTVFGIELFEHLGKQDRVLLLKSESK